MPMSYIVYVSKFRKFRKRYAYISHFHPFQETKARFFSSFLALIVMIERSMDHGESRGPALLAVAVAFLVLTWVTVSLRFYVRVFVSHSTGGDDWIMLIALVCKLFSIEVIPVLTTNRCSTQYIAD